MAVSPYPGLLTLHLLAVTVFLGGLTIDAVALSGLTRRPLDDRRRAEAGRLRQLALAVVTPALGLVWACGITMAIEAGWYEMGWLRAKVVLVLLLTALHARHLAILGRLVRGAAVHPTTGASLPALVVVAGAIAWLALAKPF